MPGQRSPEEIVTLIILNEKGQPNAQIARTLGVTEGAVRYHLRRARAGATDGRRGKPHKAGPLAHVIDHWLRDGRPAPDNDLTTEPDQRAPASPKRTASMSSGGRVRSATAIARYVDPQTT